MTRLTSVVALLGASIAMAPVAGAETQPEIAERLNNEGKSAMYRNDYAEATAKFQQAASRVGEPKYYFNLCTAQFQQGLFDDAITACNAANNTDPAPEGELKSKIDKLAQRIRDEAKAQGHELRGGGGGLPDPDVCRSNPSDPKCQQQREPTLQERCALNAQDPACQGPSRPPPPRVYRAPTQGVFTATKPDNNYTWTLGAEVYGGGGTLGQPDFYGSAAAGFRLKGDFLVNRAARVGAQAYLDYTHFSAGEMDAFGAATLDIIDIGIAGYKHLCPRGAPNLCLTPLLGAQISLMSPAGETDFETEEQVFNYAAAGVRAELGLAIAFGTRQEHVLGVNVGVKGYSSVFSAPADGFSAEEVGLDKGGAFGYLGVGYTYRFNTPLGSSPFITLE